LYFPLNTISVAEDSSVLGYDAVYFGEYFPTFREIQKVIGKHDSNDTSSHLKRYES